MKEVIYKRSGSNVTVKEVTLDEFLDLCDELRDWDGSTAADVVYIEYTDGAAFYYDGQESDGDFRDDGIACGMVINDTDVYVYGNYYVNSDGNVEAFDARLSLDGYAEACADSQTELDLVLARIACDFDTFKQYEKAFVSECKRLAEGSAYGIEHDAAEYVLGNIIGWAKEQVEKGETVSFRIYSFVGFGEYCPDPDSELLVADVADFANARFVAESREIVDSARRRCEAWNIVDSDYCSYDIVIAEVESDGSDAEVCVYRYTL